MSIAIPVTVTISDETLAAIVAAFRSAEDPARPSMSATAPDLAPGERYLDAELPKTWECVEARDGESYPWPNKQEPEHYETFSVYEGTTSRGSIRLGIGRCRRTQTWGRDRIYFVTFHMTNGGKRPLCEFLETDDYKDTHKLVAVIRGNGANQRAMFDPGVKLPSPYRHLTLVIYSRYIRAKGAWNKWAVLADEDDAAMMLNHSLIQAELRFGIRPR
jgi:hypothetical protein